MGCWGGGVGLDSNRKDVGRKGREKNKNRCIYSCPADFSKNGPPHFPNQYT